MRPGSSHRLPWWVYALVFGVALAGSIRRADFSPVVHSDTAFEEDIVHTCLYGNGCTTLGGTASFSGIYHMVGWLNFMVLGEWLGYGRDVIHLIVQVANAFKIVLIMFVADRLGGSAAAALAPYFAFQTGAFPGALYDTSLMAFFGTVLLVQCVAAAEDRPPTNFIVLTALVAAVIAEVHLSGALAFLSVVWVAMLHPPQRARRVALATTAFLLAVLIISPKTVAWDLDQVVARLSVVSPGSMPSGASGDSLLSRLPHAIAPLQFLLPWIIYRAFRSWLGPPPRGLRGVLAVCVPVAVAFSIGVLLGVLSPGSSHYLEHAYPAMAVALAVPLAAIGSRLWESVADRLRIPLSVRRVALWLVPLPLSLGAAWAQPGPMRLQPHWADVQALAHLLHDDWQWDWLTVDRELRSPEKELVLSHLSAAVPGWKTAAPRAVRRPPEPIALVQVDTRRVPDPLPRGWILVSRRTLSTLLAIPIGSALAWDDETTCVEDERGHETCLGAPVDPTLLWTLRSQPGIRRLVRRVPWRGTPGTVESVLMPELPLTCVGRIVAGPPGTEIDAAGRSARVTGAGEVTFEWMPNTPKCGIWDFLKQDDPPFVIAGAPETVNVLSRIIEPDRT
jgi:hypothetical protein